MISKKSWSICFLLVLVCASKCFSADNDDFDEIIEENEEVEVDNQPKEKYVAPIYRKPDIDSNKVHFLELFDDPQAIGKKWIKSESKKEGAEEAISKYNGEWLIGSPANVILENDYALIVRTKARHHAISAKFQKPFEFGEKPLVVQYEVKYEEGQECGGGYLKLLREDVSKDLRNFNDKSPYVVMLGPDKCGMTSKVHLIIRHKNPKNGTISEHHAKQSSKSLVNYFEDKKTHLYTLVIRPDNKYQLSIDNKEIASGDLLSDLEPSVAPPKQIPDPEDKKPAEWDDRAQIEDPEARKPEDWDETQPKEVEDVDATKPNDWLEEEEPFVPDAEAQKPADWDDEMDGDWEAKKIPNPNCADRSGCGKWTRPMKQNPLYKGKWTPPKIKNPNYKGVWSARLIDNPNYFEADPFHQLEKIGAIGFELWTMSSGIVFDNILVADDEEIAKKLRQATFDVKQTQETIHQSATSDSRSVLQTVMDTLEDKPWLWVVVILAVLIPIILVSVFCFGRKSPNRDHPKKTDQRMEDDEAEEMEMLEQETEVEDDGQQPSTSGVGASAVDEQRKDSTASASSTASSKSSRKGGNKRQKEQTDEVEEKGDEPVEAEQPSPQRPVRRARPRRQE